MTINTEDWPTRRTVGTLRQVLRHHGSQRLSFADQFSLSRRFVDALAAAPDEVRSTAEVYRLWLEVCKLRDGVLRQDVGEAHVLKLLFARTTALVLLLGLAAPMLLLHLPTVLAAEAAGRLTLDKEVVSTLKLSTGALLTLVQYVAIAVAVAMRKGWKRGALIFFCLPICGLGALRARRKLGRRPRAAGTVATALLPQEAAAVRQVRTLLQQHAQRMLAAPPSPPEQDAAAVRAAGAAGQTNERTIRRAKL